jgi:myosin heavy subunit
MDSTTKDISEIRVPPADETLPDAFAELDVKLSDWKAAMLAAQEQLIQQARAQAELQEQLESRADEQAQLQSQLETQAQSQKQVGDELRVREEAQAERVKQLEEQADAQAALEAQLNQQAEALEQASQAVQTTPGNQPPQSGPPNWTKEDIRKHIKVYGDYAKSGAEPEPKAPVPETNEDEALLASLDPETAKAIRVMRRMGGGRKSVRELLQQYQNARATARNEATRKSWFRRGR